jgi:hypothetical protein
MNDKRISFAPYPSDPRAEARERFGERSGWTRNLRASVALAVEKFRWPISAAEAMIYADVIHIWPSSAVETVFEGARRPLPESAPLYLYRPYRRGGAQTAPGNAAFDTTLRARAACGVRGFGSGRRRLAHGIRIRRPLDRATRFGNSVSTRSRWNSTAPSQFTRQCQ